MSSSNALPKVEIDGDIAQGYGVVMTARHKQPKDSSPGLKYDHGKPSLSLIDPYALGELAKVLDYGRAKYAAWNWRGGIQWSRTLDATMRHLNAFNNGEDIDPESGLPHLAHAMCNIMFLLRFTQEHPELDDRYKGATNGSHCTR